jgi:hypothetical protein
VYVSRNFLLSLIVIAASLLGWLIVEERQRTRALVRENLDTFPTSGSAASVVIVEPQLANDVAESITSNVSTTLSTASPETALSETSTESEVASASESTGNFEQPSTPIDTAVTIATSELPETSAPDVRPENASPTLAANDPPAPEVIATTDTETAEVMCSSFNETGLLATFDGALASFIAEANTLYGSQYENLQYQLSSKTGMIEGEQGTVTTNYTGTVQELSTGQDVSANGVIRATFSWNGCTWQVVDYSF